MQTLVWCFEHDGYGCVHAVDSADNILGPNVIRCYTLEDDHLQQ